MKEKKRFKHHKSEDTEQRITMLPLFSQTPLLPRSVMGIGELLSYRNAAGCEFLLFYSGYDSGTVQWIYFVVLAILTHRCNLSKCYLKLVLFIAAANYSKAFLVNCKVEKQYK